MPHCTYIVHVVNDNVQEPSQCELLLKVHKNYILDAREQKGLQTLVNRLASDFRTNHKAAVPSNTGYEYTIKTAYCQWIFRIYDPSKWCVFYYLKRIALEYCKLYNQLTWIERYVTYLVFWIVKIDQVWFFDDYENIFNSLVDKLTNEVLYGVLPIESDEYYDIEYEERFQNSIKHNYNLYVVSNSCCKPFECEFYFKIPNGYVLNKDEQKGLQTLVNTLARLSWNDGTTPVVKTGTKYTFATKQFQLVFYIYDHESESLFSSKFDLMCHIKRVAIQYCKLYKTLTWMEKYATYLLLFIAKVYSNVLLNPYGNVFGEFVHKMEIDLLKEHYEDN